MDGKNPSSGHTHTQSDILLRPGKMNRQKKEQNKGFYLWGIYLPPTDILLHGEATLTLSVIPLSLSPQVMAFILRVA